MSEDFEEQIRLEQEEQKKETTGEGTYTDSDGTVFEWDPVRKAWFPKIDEDFIAQYQMNYGVKQSGDGSESTGQDEAEASSSKKCEEYWRDYYNSYQQTNTNKSATTTKQGPEVDYTSDEYWEYYQYYYEEDGQQEEDKEVEADSADSKEENKTEKPKTDEKTGEKRKAIEGWFEHDNEKSQHVYVSGLPSDITDEEFSEMMTKCGLVMYDPFKHKPKMKLYKDADGKPKGDGLCCYIKSESVDLALQILDGSYIRDKMISVEKAKFQMKGDAFDPKKKKKKLNNKQKRKMKENLEKLFAWQPELPTTGRKKHERTVVLKHMFDPKEFDHNPVGITELTEEVRTEAVKFGTVNKVTVHDRHLDGVIVLIFKEAEEADKCIAAFNGRWFDKRQISAETWDGNTKYHIEESEEERNKRLKQWETFLEKGEAAALSEKSESDPVSTTDPSQPMDSSSSTAEPSSVIKPDSQDKTDSTSEDNLNSKTKNEHNVMDSNSKGEHESDSKVELNAKDSKDHDESDSKVELNAKDSKDHDESDSKVELNAKNSKDHDESDSKVELNMMDSKEEHESDSKVELNAIDSKGEHESKDESKVSESSGS